MMVCSSDWKIVYKNRACKKNFPVPKCNNYISKYFLSNSTNPFPDADGKIERIELDIKGSYKSVLCFEYFGYAIILFPVLLEYEAMGIQNDGYFSVESADILRSMISALSDEDIQNEDKYHRLEHVKRFVYGSLENSLAYSFLCSGDKCLYPAHKLYKLIKEKILSIAMKSGYRVQIDIEDLKLIDDLFALDLTNSSLIFCNMLLFCLSVSKNKTCFAEVSVVGQSIRNKIYFSVANDAFGNQNNTIESFIYAKPAEYLNVLPFECMCKEFGWKVEYKTENEGIFNACLCFDIGVEKIDGFCSEEMFSKNKDYAKMVCALVERALAVL
jgi:hypothetical protein